MSKRILKWDDLLCRTTNDLQNQNTNEWFEIVIPHKHISTHINKFSSADDKVILIPRSNNHVDHADVKMKISLRIFGSFQKIM